MFPDDAGCIRPVKVGALGSDDDRIRFGGRHHLFHEVVGNGAHGGVEFSTK